MGSDDSRRIADASDIIGVGPGASSEEIESAYRRLQRLLDVELDMAESHERRRMLLDERAQLEVAFEGLMSHVYAREAGMERSLPGDDIEIIEDSDISVGEGDGEPVVGGGTAAVFATPVSVAGRFALVAMVVVAVATLAVVTALVLAALK